MEARGAQEGERKHITALFADIKGSVELLENLDPEQARRIIDPALRVSLNVSGAQLAQGERLHAAIADALSASRIEPRHVEIELREGDLGADLDERTAVIRGLKTLGIGISLDDFGTGHASLACVSALPLDAIKIDATAARAARDGRAARAAIAMAHALGLAVVADGVEGAAELDALRGLGCDAYQGFVESAALAPAELEARYRARS